jgi:hypothetical protein
MTFILQERYLSGKVVDPLGNGVPNVQIQIHGSTSFGGFQDGHWSSYTTTDGTGAFSLVVFTSQSNLLRAIPPEGSEWGETSLSDTNLSNDVSDLIIQLVETITFRGYILDRDGDPIPYQAVQLYQWESGLYYSASTAEDGLFTMNILPGDYELQLSGDTTMTFILQERYLSGKVVDPLGNGVPNVQIQIHGSTSFGGFQDGHWSSYTTTDGTGTFSLVVFTSQSNALRAIPPEGSEYGPIDLSNIDLLKDKTLIIIITPFQTPPIAVTSGPYYGIEGTAIILDAFASDDPDGTIELYEWDVNGDGLFDISSTASIDSFIPSDNYEGSITLQVTDNDGLTSQTTTEIVVENAAPILSDIIAPFDPVALGTPLLASASFSDPGILDTHDAVWDWGDSITSPGIVTEEGGSGTVNGDHVYTVPGVYTITLTLSDDDGGLASDQFSYVVIYDNEQGFVTGGGWFTSPEGAYPADPSLSDKANFGFVSKYKKGTMVPTGNTEFQFHAGDLNFHSDTYEWLVIAGAKARFKGTGMINGEGSYKFILTAFDGAINGGVDEDKFRIKIWLENEETGEEDIIYDNQLSVIDGGGIKIHKG